MGCKCVLFILNLLFCTLSTAIVRKKQMLFLQSVREAIACVVFLCICALLADHIKKTLFMCISVRYFCHHKEDVKTQRSKWWATLLRFLVFSNNLLLCVIALLWFLVVWGYLCTLYAARIILYCDIRKYDIKCKCTMYLYITYSLLKYICWSFSVFIVDCCTDTRVKRQQQLALSAIIL